MKLTRRTLDQIHSPIGAAFALVPQRRSDRRLLDLSQAAPSCAPPPAITEHLADAITTPDIGRYVRQEGLPELREAFAAELSDAYPGAVAPDQVMITAGCNQAFTLITSALCEKGDRVILPVPFYFNHDMWLRLDGVAVDHVETVDGDLQHDPAAVEALITDRTRAIVVVTPGNPTGVTTAPERIEAFADLARRHKIALILDETYRSFRPDAADPAKPAHRLFERPDWDDYVVSLHSFSKEFAIPGFRVGAAVGRPDLLAEALKVLDCVTICTPRIGQEAALAGLTGGTDWRAAQAAKIRVLQGSFEAMMAARPGGFELRSAGAYFGWVRHPGRKPTDEVIKDLLFVRDVLAIPGTAFTPTDEHMLRMSFANLDPADIDLLGDRLAE